MLVSQKAAWETCSGRGDVSCRPEWRLTKYQSPDKREVAERISIIQTRKHTIGEGVLPTSEKSGTGCHW
jgi:hypothetical protein